MDFLLDYTGDTNSLTDQLKYLGMDGTYEDQEAVAKYYGITDYTGSAEQNYNIVECLKTHFPISGRIISSELQGDGSTNNAVPSGITARRSQASPIRGFDDGEYTGGIDLQQSGAIGLTLGGGPTETSNKPAGLASNEETEDMSSQQKVDYVLKKWVETNPSAREVNMGAYAELRLGLLHDVCEKGMDVTKMTVAQLDARSNGEYNDKMGMVVAGLGMAASIIGNSTGQNEGNSETKGTGNAISVNPDEIRFSQSSVNGAEEIIQSMRKNGWNGDPIDVIRMSDGKLTTIDNTRVVAAREVGIEVQANIHDANEPLPKDLVDRFTTKKGVPSTWGEAIELRIGKQNASFRNNNPFGADTMERIGKP